ELIGYPSLVLLYLGNYPDGGRKQVLYVCAWVLGQSLIEAASYFIFNGINYAHGWNYWWSILFNMFFYVILRIHYLNPQRAWAISVVVLLLHIRFLIPVPAMR
ncbi:hypothetical protein SD70_32115, partial [Gordoniibacillus kamchatkensis]